MDRISRWVLACTLLLVFAAASASAAGGKINWVRGFPQRIGSQVVLMWEPFPGAAKYTVFRMKEGETNPQTLESASNNIVDDKAELTATYTYRVSAFDPGNGKIAEGPASVVKGYVPLDPPKWGGSYQDGPGLLLSWQGDHRTAFYNLYRNLQGETAKVIATIQATRYLDEDIKPETTYEYFLRSVDQSGMESKDSARISIRVSPWESRKEAPVERRRVEISKFKLAPEITLSEPTKLVIRNGVIYLTDTGSRSVMALLPDGKLLRRFAVRPPDYQGAWGIPWGISADADGKRFAVTFLKSQNLRVFDEIGQMILDVPVMPPPELKPDQYLPSLPQPMDVAIEDQEGFWLTDYTYAQLIFIDVRGKEMGRVGKSRVEKDFGPFRSPNFLVVHPASGYIVVVDSIQSKLFRVFNNGKVAGVWGNNMKGEGSLHLPKGIDVNEKGEILVVDGMLSTLQAFDQSGKLLAVYVPEEEETQKLPLGMVTLAVNRDNGDIYVISKVENAIFRLRPVK